MRVFVPFFRIKAQPSQKHYGRCAGVLTDNQALQSRTLFARLILV